MVDFDSPFLSQHEGHCAVVKGVNQHCQIDPCFLSITLQKLRRLRPPLAHRALRECPQLGRIPEHQGDLQEGESRLLLLEKSRGRQDGKKVSQKSKKIVHLTKYHNLDNLGSIYYKLLLLWYPPISRKTYQDTKISRKIKSSASDFRLGWIQCLIFFKIPEYETI